MRNKMEVIVYTTCVIGNKMQCHSHFCSMFCLSGQEEEMVGAEGLRAFSELNYTLQAPLVCQICDGV